MSADVGKEDLGPVLVDGSRFTLASLALAALGGAALGAQQPVATASPGGRGLYAVQGLLAVVIIGCWVGAFRLRKTVIQVCSQGVAFLTAQGWQTTRWVDVASSDLAGSNAIRLRLADGTERQVDLRWVGGRSRIIEFVNGRVALARKSVENPREGAG